jgi:hypothetical protein
VQNLFCHASSFRQRARLIIQTDYRFSAFRPSMQQIAFSWAKVPRRAENSKESPPQTENAFLGWAAQGYMGGPNVGL